MAVEVVHARGGPRSGRRWALVGLAALQVLVPVLVPLWGGGAFTTADRSGEPPIVPVGAAFAIWGLVELLCLAYALWALPLRRRRADPETDALVDRLTTPLLVVFAGFSVWIVVADLEPVWATLVVFLVMLAALVRAMSLAVGATRWSPLGRRLLWAMLGVYTGWSSVAIWVNLTTAFTGSGAPTTGAVGVVAQVAVLAGATATAVALTRRFGAPVGYVLAVLWGLLTSLLGSAGAGQPVLAAVAALGALAVLLAAAPLWLRPGGRPVAAR